MDWKEEYRRRLEEIRRRGEKTSPERRKDAGKGDGIGRGEKTPSRANSSGSRGI